MIDAAIDRLERAYRGAGLRPVRRARRTRRVLGEIAREIHPLRLPAQVETFWRRIDPSSITVAPYPRPVAPAAALAGWRQLRSESPDIAPRLLFPVCHESDGWLSVELDDGSGGDGALVFWTAGGQVLRVDFPDLASYLDLLATMVELEEFVPRHEHGVDWIHFDPEHRWHDAVTVRLASAQPLPRLGRSREFRRPAEWPEHWLRSDGRSSPERHGGGATTTAADLLSRAAAGAEVTGTIRARVERLLTSGSGARVTVDDGSALLDVWCPPHTCADGPVIGRTFDFDVVVQPRPPVPPDLDAVGRVLNRLADATDAGDPAVPALEREAAELMERIGNTPATAEATAVRPVT